MVITWIIYPSGFSLHSFLSFLSVMLSSRSFPSSVDRRYWITSPHTPNCGSHSFARRPRYAPHCVRILTRFLSYWNSSSSFFSLSLIVNVVCLTTRTAYRDEFSRGRLLIFCCCRIFSFIPTRLVSVFFQDTDWDDGWSNIFSPLFCFAWYLYVCTKWWWFRVCVCGEGGEYVIYLSNVCSVAVSTLAH